MSNDEYIEGSTGFCIYCGEALDEDGLCWDHPGGPLSEAWVPAFDFTTGEEI